VLTAAGHVADPPRRAVPAGLTEREAQVLGLVARGLSNRQVGTRLGITPRTVGHHVAHVYAKIGVSTRPGATLFAVEHGLVATTP
jgi:DNA-binding CsgD family transcriptional regulator